LFKHNIIEWQSRGIRPNPDYISTQKKMKRIKNESINGMGNLVSEYEKYEAINMNYQASNSNHPAQQIINVNQYTNQTYIINNINPDGLKLGESNFNNLNLHYNNYYAWTGNNGTNFGYNQNDLQTGDLQVTNNNMLYNQNLPQLQSSIEDSLSDKIKTLIKRIYKLYFTHLNPYLLTKDTKSKNYQNFQLALTYNGYQPNSSLNYNNTNEDYYKKSFICEILKYFQDYARQLNNFLEEFDGRLYGLNNL
jgi:hypothetical protein